MHITESQMIELNVCKCFLLTCFIYTYRTLFSYLSCVLHRGLLTVYIYWVWIWVKPRNLLPNFSSCLRGTELVCYQ